MNFRLWGLDGHPELIDALFTAHRAAALDNNNASRLAVQQSYGGSGRFENAIIAGMATIGALHAPLCATRALLDLPLFAAERQIARWAARHERIPGFGNSFHPDGDPAFQGVMKVLSERYKPFADVIDALALMAEKATGKRIAPNAAMYTAMTAIICQVPKGLEPTLFALARIPAWADLCGTAQHPAVGRGIW